MVIEEFDEQHFIPLLGVKDIALQLIMENPGHNIKVALGGGWKSFLPKNNSKMYALIEWTKKSKSQS